MKKPSLVFAEYWNKSLADATLIQGRLEASDVALWTKHPFGQGRVRAALMQQLFKEQSNQENQATVILRPYVFTKNRDYRKQAGVQLPSLLSPITTIAQLKPNGRLYPLKSYFSQDLLEPIEDGMYAIGAVNNLERFLRGNCYTFTSHSHQDKANDAISVDEQWNQYLKACELALKVVCGPWLQRQKIYTQLEYGYIYSGTKTEGKFRFSRDLYHYILKHPHLELPLLETFTRDEGPLKQPNLPAHANFSKRLAIPDEHYRYTSSQRDALAHIIELKDSEILAVNCPASTGKINLIEAAVAMQWAQAALNKDEYPPITFAISTNSNSLQKIIDAFGKNLLTSKNPFEGRWLSDLSPVYSKRNKLSNIPEFNRAEECDDLFEAIETLSYYERAKEGYLITAQLNHPQIKTDSVLDVITYLHELIEKETERLASLENAWHNIVHSEEKISSKLGDSPDMAIGKVEAKLKEAAVEFDLILEFSNRWEAFLAKRTKVISSLLTLLPSYSQKIFAEAQAFLKENTLKGFSFEHCKSINEISQTIEALLAEKRESFNDSKIHLEQIQEINNEDKIRSINWAEAIIDLLAESGFENVKTLSDADLAADSTIRYNIFQHTTHYWEGRWLLEMEKLLQGSVPNSIHLNSEEAILNKWRRRMMLVPCMATTCNALPKLFQAENESTLDQKYLTNSIDLLIFDQAGQIPPDIAGASFALAKKSLAFGDTLQSTPVSLINRFADTENLQKFDLASSQAPEQDFLKQSNFGRTASLGNVMRVAQTASKYHQNSKIGAGLFLSEERESYEEILHFCNHLGYDDQIQSKRGRKTIAAMREKRMLDALPPLAYLHVDGLSYITKSGSYKNLSEAQAIANWLVQNQTKLEQYYQEPIAKIVSIATPYLGQVHAIIHACQNMGIDATGWYQDRDKLLVGTSRTIQGSQTPVILFSNVLSKHLSYEPTRNEAKLFNVVASHAHDAFILFADMDRIEQALTSSPRGILTKLLTSNESNRLYTSPIVRTELTTKTQMSKITCETLVTDKDHEFFFEEITANKAMDIVIACPALELCTLRSTATLHHLVSAVERGASVRIVTDIPTLQRSNSTADTSLTISDALQDSIQLLKAINIPVHLAQKIYNITLIADHDIYCTGSFHWLNHRDNALQKTAKKTIVYRGAGLTMEIQMQRNTLRKKVISVV